MSSRNLFASILMACLLTVGSGGVAPGANAASVGQSFLNSGMSARNSMIEIKNRGGGARIQLRIGPSYSGYDFPYYYSRGYYPTHVGPGYVYNYPIYDYRPAYSPRDGDRCSKWHRRCVDNWGDSNEDYYGCMDHHGCE